MSATERSADFNGDGNLDLAVPGYTFGGVTILLGTGDGGFTEGVATVPGQSARLAVGDFNEDTRAATTVRFYWAIQMVVVVSPARWRTT